MCDRCYVYSMCIKLPKGFVDQSFQFKELCPETVPAVLRPQEGHMLCLGRCITCWCCL